MDEPTFTVEHSDPTQVNEFLDGRLREHNVAATGFADALPLHARVTVGTDEVVAAMSGHTWGGTLEIVFLWVHEAHRGRGLGRALLQAAEAEAAGRGCGVATLATHSFQAPAFYEKLGYERAGEIRDYPRGHSKLQFVKRLR